MRVFAVEFEIGRQPSPQAPHPGQQRGAAWLFSHLEAAFTGDDNFHVVAFFELKDLDNRGW
jgi:hypothetical protein